MINSNNDLNNEKNNELKNEELSNKLNNGLNNTDNKIENENDNKLDLNNVKLDINNLAKNSVKKNQTYLERSNQNPSLLHKIFNKSFSKNDKASQSQKGTQNIDSLISLHKNSANNLNSTFGSSNWNFKDDDSIKSQYSLMTSNSTIRNRKSSSFNRLKLDSKEVDVIRSKSNINNIFEQENGVNSNYDSNAELNDFDNENKISNIQKSFSKFKRPRKGSTLITGFKIDSPETAAMASSQAQELALALPVQVQDSYSENNNNVSEDILDDKRKNSNGINIYILYI